MTKSLLALRTSVRDRLDEDTQRFWLDTQLNRWINEGAKDIARKTESLQTRVDIATTANTQEYSLPVDSIRIHRVEWRRSGDDQVFPLEYRDFNSIDSITWTAQTTSRGTPYLFTMWGFAPSLKLVLYPTPETAGSLKIFYYRLPTERTSDGDMVEVPEGWEDLIVDYAEMMALRKDSDPRWQEAKALYDERLGNMYDVTRRMSDQGGMMVSESGAGVPGWLWGED